MHFESLTAKFTTLAIKGHPRLLRGSESLQGATPTNQLESFAILPS